MKTKLSEEQKYSIIEAVYRYVGDDFDMDEHGNAAIKFDSQDLKLLDRIESIIYPNGEGYVDKQSIIKEIQRLCNYYGVKCTNPECKWEGFSDECVGGGQIADTGDYDDPQCPKCYGYIDDCDNPFEDEYLKFKRLISLLTASIQSKLDEKERECERLKKIIYNENAE